MRQNPWSAFDPEGLSAADSPGEAAADSGATPSAPQSERSGTASSGSSSIWDAGLIASPEGFRIKIKEPSGPIPQDKLQILAPPGTKDRFDDVYVQSYIASGGETMGYLDYAMEAGWAAGPGTLIGMFESARGAATGYYSNGEKLSGWRRAWDATLTLATVFPAARALRFEEAAAAKGAPNLRTGVGYNASDAPVRIEGPWSVNDMKQGLLGHPPRSLGSPDIHHCGQMPGGAKHEIIPSQHRNNPALHPNPNQGVTPEMRQSDRQMHWWYRAREQGADQVLPGWIYD